MERRVCPAALFIFLIPMFAYTQLYDAGIPQNAQQIVFQTARSSGSGFEPYVQSAALFYSIAHSSFAAFGGMQVTDTTFDCTVQGLYRAFQWGCLQGSAVLLSHTSVIAGTGFSEDILPGVLLQCTPCPWYTVTLQADYMLKMQHADGIEGLFSTNEAAFFLISRFALPLQFSAWFVITSFEPFRYNNFFSPAFIFGAGKQLSDQWSLSAEYAVRYTNLFLISAYMDSMELSMKAAYRF